MIKTFIVADDSTGANASAILLKQLDLSAISLINYSTAAPIEGYDVIAISTDSRAIASTDAYERVKTVLDHFKQEEIMVLNKRIDSTLRGNLGSELNAFKEIFPKRKIAIVPAYPDSGRICKDGQIYVMGVPLQHSDAAKDPKMPIDTADAKTLFMKQFHGVIVNMKLDEVRNPQLTTKIQAAYQTADAIIFDAETNEEIRLVADALTQIQFDLITVDPGKFTAVYAAAKMQQIGQTSNRFLFAIGSTCETTLQQLEYAQKIDDFDLIVVQAEKLLDPQNGEKEKQKALTEILHSSKKVVILTTVDSRHPQILDLHQEAERRGLSVDDVSKIINDAVTDILDQALTKLTNIRGIYTSGGDITLSFLLRNQAKGIELYRQVMPLCVCGKIVSGKYDGLPIITKGGMIGANDAIETIYKFYQEVTKNV